MRLAVFLFGVVLGLIPGTLVYFVGFDFLVDKFVDQLFSVLFGAIGIMILLFFMYLVRDNLSRWIFGSVRGDLERMTNHAIETVYAITRGRGRLAANEARHFAEELMAWWVWANGLRFAFGAVFGLVAVFAASLGTFLLFRQNEIMRDQIDLAQAQQSFLAAQDYENRLLAVIDSVAEDRMVSVSAKTQITRLLDEEDQVLERKISGDESDTPRCRTILYYEKKTRIVRLLLEAGARPNELGLISLDKIDLSNMNLSGLDFQGLDVSGASFVQSNLSQAKFKRMSKISANFLAANLTEAEFDNTQISESCFDRVNALRASFYSSGIRNTTFKGAILDGSDFQERGIVNVDFFDASLINAYFDQQHLETVSFKNAFMPFAQFGAHDEDVSFENVDFTGANVSSVDFYWVEATDDATSNSLKQACISQNWKPCGSDGKYIELPMCTGRIGQGVNYTRLDSRGRASDANDFPTWELHTNECRRP